MKPQKLEINEISGHVRKLSAKSWVKKFKTVITNSKYVTGCHFQEKLPPLFLKLANFNGNALAIPVLKPEYENITPQLSHM